MKKIKANEPVRTILWLALLMVLAIGFTVYAVGCLKSDDYRQFTYGNQIIEQGGIYWKDGATLREVTSTDAIELYETTKKMRLWDTFLLILGLTFASRVVIAIGEFERDYTSSITGKKLHHLSFPMYFSMVAGSLYGGFIESCFESKICTTWFTIASGIAFVLLIVAYTAMRFAERQKRLKRIMPDYND